MKKIILISILFFPLMSFARLSVNPQFGYSMKPDILNCPIYGAAIEGDIVDSFALGLSFLAGDYTENADRINEQKLSEKEAIIYLQYRYQISQSPFYALGQIGGGFSSTNVSKVWGTDTNQSEKSDKGMMLAFDAGAMYNVSQRFSLYFLAGYVNSFYSGSLYASDVSASGWQMYFGVKINVFGGNTDIMSYYE